MMNSTKHLRGDPACNALLRDFDHIEAMRKNKYDN